MVWLIITHEPLPLTPCIDSWPILKKIDSMASTKGNRGVYDHEKTFMGIKDLKKYLSLLVRDRDRSCCFLCSYP